MKIVFLLGALLNPAHCIFEKNKGINEWRIENLGNLQDVKFVEESSQMYAISKDGLLSYFDLETQKFLWKKKLTIPQSNVG
jgi:hypothetical protein